MTYEYEILWFCGTHERTRKRRACMFSFALFWHIKNAKSTVVWPHMSCVIICGFHGLESTDYGAATMSRHLKIIHLHLFCKRALWKRLCVAKKTYNLKEPANHSHPIAFTWLAVTCPRIGVHLLFLAHACSLFVSRWLILIWRFNLPGVELDISHPWQSG